MKIKIKNVSFNLEYFPEEVDHKFPIVFLHGFTGSKEDWEFLINKIPGRFTPVLIDLIGHGKSSSPADPKYYSPDLQVYFLNEILNRIGINKLILVGYSMGGRLAVAFSEKYTDRIEALILESTSFGIQSEKERKERIAADKNLAEKIENIKMDMFIDQWLKLPLFESLHRLPDKKIAELRSRKIKSNNVLGLKNSLLGFGTGLMKNYLPHLQKFKCKVFLIVGEYDKKYIEISRRAKEHFHDCRLKVVKKSGHNVHFENTDDFLKLINEFLINI